MNGFYEAVKQQLRRHGYRLLRQGKGAHEIWTNGQRNVVVSHNMQARPTANAIMKQANIAHRF
jgi:predicted RNA binding protein YcfA (HicA-like mRNA interferase family)